MRSLQRYMFRQLLSPLVLSVAALATLAILSQTLSSLSFLVDEGESFLLFLKIVGLTLPQLLSLVLPVALFIAVVHGLHRLHTDSELVVATTSGMGRWGVIAPVLRITALVMVAHLAIAMWLQPFAHREMRRTMHDARVDLAGAIISPGEFAQPSEDLTIFVREIGPDGLLHEVMIYDESNSQPVWHHADTGRLVESATSPTIMMQNGSIQTVEEDGRLSFLNFDSVPFDLAAFVEPPGQLHYKLSDRYLSDLFYPSQADYWERDNAGAMIAEGHARLAQPLYDLALAAIAALALLGGDFSRTGYGRRIFIASVIALTVRLSGFAVESAAAGQPFLNTAQYGLPLGVAALALALYFRPRLAGRPAPLAARRQAPA